jgi:hypothetical protein
MISLQVEKYCENYPEFEVRQETLRMGFFDSSYLLMCQHAEKCRNLHKYIWGVKND